MGKKFVTCPKCGKEESLDKFKVLAEAAVLTCPTCGTQIELRAFLTQPLKKEPMKGPEGGSEEIPSPPSGGVSLPPPAPVTPSESFVSHVMRCESCKATWIPVFGREKCPECGSEKVVEDNTSVDERIKQAFKEVAKGTPVKEVADRLFGKRVNEARWTARDFEGVLGEEEIDLIAMCESWEGWAVAAQLGDILLATQSPASRWAERIEDAELNPSAIAVIYGFCSRRRDRYEAADRVCRAIEMWVEEGYGDTDVLRRG